MAAMRMVGVLTLVLAGCGGGGSSEPDVPEVDPEIAYREQAFADMRAECHPQGISRWEFYDSPKGWRAWCEPDAQGRIRTVRRDV
jgi:hypothetical protein